MNKKAYKNEKDESNENKTRMEKSISEISQRIIDDIDKASLKNLSDAKYAKKILRLSDLKYTKKLFRKMENISDRTENSIEKRAVIQALLFSTWIQRLYFIIRAGIMSILAAAVTFVYVSFFGQIGVVLALGLGILIFFVGLIVTRLFDPQILKITKFIVRHLNHHERVRDFVLNHF